LSPTANLGDQGPRAGVETGIRFRTRDADGDNAELRSRGLEVGEVLRWPSAPAMFELHDQDGNRLEIIEQAADATS
jgi:hypothetical protein